MTEPRAVVIPFGVPDEGRGLGLGLAALVHAFARVEGGGVALAQLHSRAAAPGASAPPSLIEAFVPPSAWHELAGRGDAPARVEVVLTGAFEPPVDGHGTLELLAFDARDGRTRARAAAPIDDGRAGASLVAAFEQLWSGLGGEIGALQGLRDLGWEPLESVLRAERCAMHDPARGGPHDRLAAMLHLGRAIGDAPEAVYPAERLVSIAIETGARQPLDRKLAAGAVRALERATHDAPTRPDLVEALGALLLLLDQPREAERRINAALARAPRRARLYALLAEALRAQGNLDGALSVLEAGLSEAGRDPLLYAEKGTILAARGDLPGARAAWRDAVARDPVHPVAYGNLASLAMRTGDGVAAQSLVDVALASARAHPDVLRRAVQLALGTEAEGLARAARLARLCERILEQAADDAPASLALARALVALGERRDARARLVQIEALHPRTSAAAAAQATRLALDDPRAELEVQSVLRAAQVAGPDELADVGARARRLATMHGAWRGWLAAAVAERRRGRLAAARGALDVALELAPGATPAHLELTDVLLGLDEAAAAVSHAERALALDGDSPRALGALARALAAAGRTNDAGDTVRRGLALYPDDAGLVALAPAGASSAKGRRASRWSRALAVLERWTRGRRLSDR